MKRLLPALLVLAVVSSAVTTRAQSRPFRIADIHGLRIIESPQVSPEGDSVVFTVSRDDEESDSTQKDLWLLDLKSGQARALTFTKDDDESVPRFSPDGRWISFIARRSADRPQIYLLDRRGGEAEVISSFEGDVSDYTWSPDGLFLVAVVKDKHPKQKRSAESIDEKKHPLVIRRRQFLRDGEGFLDERRDHLWRLDLSTRSVRRLTEGAVDHSSPLISAATGRLVFVANRTAEADSNFNSDIFSMVPEPGSTPVPISTGVEADHSPVISSDGRMITWIRDGDPADLWYAPNRLMIRPLDLSREEMALTEKFDRNIDSPAFTKNGQSIIVLRETHGTSELVEVDTADSSAKVLLTGEREISWCATTPDGTVLLLESDTTTPFEITRLENGVTRKLTTLNQSRLSGLRLAIPLRRSAKSENGPAIDYFFTPPAQRFRGKAPPALVWLHGGPAAQYTASFDVVWQVFAAAGYAVIAPNPRGSSGYGREFSRAIFADWGNKDYDDVMACVDDAIAAGLIDGDRLGIGGWSYGGILTNCVLTRSERFKAAISGASEVNYTSCYGTDHYQREWEAELGLPWRNQDLWIRLSPFFSADKIKTPTLVLCGADDVNVPLLNSQQLYLALKRLGVETELVIYPDEAHELTRPSFRFDRLERYVAWFDRFLKPAAPVPSVTARVPEAMSLLGEPLFSPEIPFGRRERIETQLAAATTDFVRNPDGADAIVWMGRRLAYAGKFRDAVSVFTRGTTRYPEDWRMFRHRGHRYITLRDFKKAISDFETAARLIDGKPPVIEPDGDPNPAGIPVSTSHFNVFYHLGLSHFLDGNFEAAFAAYSKGLEYSKDNPDRLVAMSDWAFRAARRLGKQTEARALLNGIDGNAVLLENHAYGQLLRFYKGEIGRDVLLSTLSGGANDAATIHFGIGHQDLVNGDLKTAQFHFEAALKSGPWPAFGAIAAEAELARLRPKENQ